MKPWIDFLPDLLVDLPGCPDPVIEHALLRASQAFFSRAHVWRYSIEAINTRVGVQQYDMDLPVRSELVLIKSATLDGQPVRVRSIEELPSNWRSIGIVNEPMVFTEDRQTVHVLPIPISVQPLAMEVCLKPSNAALGIEDRFFDQYVEAISNGAKARLMMQSEKPYSNPALGVMFMDRFDDAISDAAIRMFRGFSSTSLSVRPRAFGSAY